MTSKLDLESAVNHQSRCQSVLWLEVAGNLWGSERFLIDILKVAGGTDLHSSIVCPKDCPLLDELTQFSNLTIYPILDPDLHTRSRIVRFINLVRLICIINKVKPDILFANHGGSSHMAMFGSALAGGTVVGHIQLKEDVLYAENLRSSMVNKTLGGVVCDSQYIASLFQQRTYPKSITHIYSPYFRQNTNYEAVPKTNPSDQLACVGRLVEIKGQDLLLRALGILSSRNLALPTHFFGTGNQNDSYECELRSLSTQLKLDSLVSWKGFCPDVGAQLPCYSFLIVPSKVEPLGRVVLEAWDAGVIPVVYRNSGGAAEIVTDSRGGLVFDEWTPESLGSTIREALALSDQQRRDLIASGRRWMKKNTDPEVFFTSLLHFFGTVLSE